MSLFKNLFRYTQSALKSPQEDFLTEILAYCLINDIEFQRVFLNNIGITEYDSSKLKVTTQKTYIEGKPDIIIDIEHKLIVLVECKYGSPLGEEQLERYTKILDQQTAKQKKLIFLTKNYHTFNQDLNIIHLRWFQIFTLLNSSNDLITKEFKKYLKELGMDQQQQFTLEDYQTLQTVQSTNSKMIEVLSRVMEKFNRNMESAGGQSPETRARESWFGHYAEFSNKKIYIGFKANKLETVPSAFLEVECKDLDLKSQMHTFLSDTNNNWEIMPNSIMLSKNLELFNNTGNTQFDAIESFFNNGIDELTILKKQFNSDFV